MMTMHELVNEYFKDRTRPVRSGMSYLFKDDAKKITTTIEQLNDLYDIRHEVLENLVVYCHRLGDSTKEDYMQYLHKKIKESKKCLEELPVTVHTKIVDLQKYLKIVNELKEAWDETNRR